MVRSPISVEEAEAVIDVYFTVAKEVFVKGGATRVKKVVLEIARWVHDSPRHYAATEETGRRIVAAPEFAELPEPTLAAILAHEFGHAVDFLYPGEFAVMDDGELVRMPPTPKTLIDKKAEQAMIARLRAWSERDKDTVERTADAIAEHFTGRPIGYMGPCELQSFERGGVRPRRLGLR